MALRPAQAMVSTLWLVLAAFVFGLFAFCCGFAIGFRSSSRLLQRGSNQVETGDGTPPLDAGTRRKYLNSAMSECFESDLWMRLKHHDDSSLTADAPQDGGSSAGTPSTMNLEFRILALLDERVGYAVQALRDGIEVSLAVCEALYILRVAYFHLRAHHTHNNEVEDMIEIYENRETDNYHARRNCALRLVFRNASQYNLHRGRSIIEELKMVMDCLIHRSSFIVYEHRCSLNSTMDALWQHVQADIRARDTLISASRPMSEDDMSVDDHVDAAVADPPVATPDIEHELEMLQGARQRAMSTLSRRVQNALDRDDFDAADFYDQHLTMVNLT